MQNFTQVLEELSCYYGTDNYYHQMNKRSIYTDGFKAFLDLVKCHWLYSIIESEIFAAIKELSPNLYTFKIQSNKQKTCLSLSTGDEIVIWSKIVPHAILPEGEMPFLIHYDGQLLISYLVSEH